MTEKNIVKEDYFIEILKDQGRVDLQGQIETFALFWLTKSGLDALSDISNILRTEMDQQVSHGKDFKTEFEKVLDSLFQRFQFEDLDDEGGLESAIIRKIEELKDNSMIEEFNKIKELLLNLRKERIQFWEDILATYKEDPIKYKNEFLKLILGRIKRLSGHIPKDIQEKIKNFKLI